MPGRHASVACGMADDPTPPPPPSINVTPDGPLVLTGGVPVVRRRIVESEHGEPLTYETTEDLGRRDRVQLCRCGESATKPFCDASHRRTGFAADDTAGGRYADRATELGGTGITVRDDRSVCVHAGFCGNRVTNVWKSVAATDDSTVRAQVIAMIEHCPSGALTFRLDPRGRGLGAVRDPQPRDALPVWRLRHQAAVRRQSPGPWVPRPIRGLSAPGVTAPSRSAAPSSARARSSRSQGRPVRSS